MTTRVTGEPAYVLHHYDWSESSVIVEAFTRHYGRVALVARGAKKPSSNFRPVLLPMQALLLAWSGDAEVRALKGAEWGGGPVMPAGARGGDALLAGYYTNELLLRLLARDDPHPRLFDGYTLLIGALAEPWRASAPAAGPPEDGARPHAEYGGANHATSLRAFELLLLREAGLLPALDAATLTLAPLAAGQPYHLSPEGGLLACDGVDGGTPALPGACWLVLEQALADALPFAALRAAIEPWTPRERAQLRQLLRVWLYAHGGGQPLKTRQLLHDLQAL
ncbi:MAG: DNA repair protein RecO [Burkholderiaceae bacterium]|jgi:DNA repair protein RecO (recombination protein O)|nr:DNA repair protein RecO [Burkholderiaceae bacterium]